MATLASELDLTMLPFSEDGDEYRRIVREGRAQGQWLFRSLLGYGVASYEDALGILRDKRWHSASGRIPEMMGITRTDFLERQGESILSAEGDVHTRLRRLVAPAFSPRSADRLRPFMRETVEGLIAPSLATGRTEVVGEDLNDDAIRVAVAEAGYSVA